ncbi:MAG: DUF420 domain-containing protein [Verrucomicrobiota bacterium]
MEINDIPALNAALNGVATLLLLIGFALIKTGNETAHRKVMTSALAVSVLFLIGYLYHKYLLGSAHTTIGAEGFIYWAYIIMLATHIILAMFIVPLVLRTFYLAIKGKYDLHKKWAKWTYPIWLYVSVTGVLVYFCLYQWWPSAATLSGKS